jgi:hypothetical protein
MFATRVVTLPSAISPANCESRPAGREVTVDTGSAEFSELSYVAFYADCEHEALPVQEGNRVCPVYNLVQKRAKIRNRTLKAPEYETQVADTACCMKRLAAGLHRTEMATVVVDGTPSPIDALARILISHEVWSFDLKIIDSLE